MACYYPFLDGWLAVVPKVGYQSFRQAFKDKGIRSSTPNAVGTKPLHVFVRHPVARLASAWGYFQGVGQFPRRIGMPDWPKFVDNVLSEQWSDFHWDAQLRQLCRPPETVWRFEDLHDVWPRLTTMRLPHLNKSKVERPDTSYRKDDVEAFYAEDMAAWRSA